MSLEIARSKKISTAQFERVSNNLRSVFLLALLFFLVFLFITFAIPPRCAHDGYFAALKDKHRILKNTTSPKIVFIGGSNLAFGLDSSLIEKKLHMPVVNMGICAPFGLRYILEEVKDNVNPGDIIVIVPEYGMLQNIVDCTADLMHTPEVYPPALLFILRAYTTSPQSFFKLLELTRSMPTAKWSAFHTILTNMWQQGYYDAATVEHWEIKNQIGPATRYYFDKHGDYFGHFGRPHLAFSPNWEIISKMAPEATDLINNFNTCVAKRGAKAVMIPSPIPSDDLLPGRCSANSIANWPGQSLSLPVLARPQRYAFAYNMFYQPPYHLNIEGRTIRSALMAEDLGRFLSSSNSHSNSVKLSN